MTQKNFKFCLGTFDFNFFLFFVKTDKKKKSIKTKCSQKNFKTVLGHHASYQKKLSKKLLKGANLVLQKGTKESKLSLGYWIVVWEANEICTFLSEFKSLKNEKINYLMSKL